MFDDPLMSATSAAVLQVLEGVAQLSMEVGLAVGDLHALLEIAFVAAAQNVLSESGEAEPDNPARIAVRTGLYRHNVSDLLSLADARAVRNKPFQHHTVRVMRAWLTTPDYVEADGTTPKVLPVRGKSPCFNSLVSLAIKSDLPPKLILRDLQRIGAIKTPAKGHVQLVRRTYGNPAWDADSIRGMGEALSVHLRACLQTLYRREPEPVLRYIARSDLPAGTAAIIARELGRGAKVLFNAQQRAADHEAARASGTSASKERLGAVLAVFTEPVSPSGPAARRRRPPKSATRRAKVKPRKSR